MYLWIWLLSQYYFMHTSKQLQSLLRIKTTSDDDIIGGVEKKPFFKVKNQFANSYPPDFS